jgi:hypothetical protein
MKKFSFLTALFCASLSFGQGFTDDFSSNTGITASFNRTLGGATFKYTFSTLGDGGDFAWENKYGFNGSSSINAASADANTGTTERITIVKDDASRFAFTSIFINNTAGTTVTVAGYLNGVMVGSAQMVNTGSSSNLTFQGVIVNEVRITSTDFFNTNIDQFVGNSDPVLGLENNDSYNSNVFISPNPTSDYINISGLSDSKNYVIYDAQGNKIMDGSFTDSVDQKISLDMLKIGLYFLNIDNHKSLNFIKL